MCDTLTGVREGIRTVTEMFDRRQSFQTVAWFRDLYRRGLLNLDPPYQRRSVWNQAYRDFFIETILLKYPAPAIFIHENISPDGLATYSVVDGKQRLTTIFDFVEDDFPVADNTLLTQHAGRYFSTLPDDAKKSFWSYQFSVEYLPTTEEATLTNVFDRINRNVARLTRQELRHARFGGEFATATERLNDHLVDVFGTDVPRIATSSRRQMKDVELVAQILLLLENGPQAFSQDDLDDAYSARDEEWESASRVEARFREIVHTIRLLAKEAEWPAAPMRRLRNQADFYSLFGAYAVLHEMGKLPSPQDSAHHLSDFMNTVADENKRELSPDAKAYFNAARSASNDLSQRRARIDVLGRVLVGEGGGEG
jgi:hypothetical protein